MICLHACAERLYLLFHYRRGGFDLQGFCSFVNIWFWHLKTAEETLYFYESFVRSFTVMDGKYQRQIPLSGKWSKTKGKKTFFYRSTYTFETSFFFFGHEIKLHESTFVSTRETVCTSDYVFVTMFEAAPVTVTSCLIFYHFRFFAIFIVGFEVGSNFLFLLLFFTTPCVESHLKQRCKKRKQKERKKI